MTKIKLRKTRVLKGISQEDLAENIGMSQSQYSRREGGKMPISDLEWERIADALGVEKDEIFEENTNNFVINNGENSGDYSGNYNTYHGMNGKILEKLMCYIELLEEKIETIKKSH